MDDGELDFSNQELDFSIPNMTGELPSSCSMENIFGDFFKETDTACTHNHICNPPSGPDSAHRHTCIHVHTKILSSGASEDKAGTDDTAESGEKNSKKRPLGNREAVRKYREKKKARAASLEDEVITMLHGHRHGYGDTIRTDTATRQNSKTAFSTRLGHGKYNYLFIYF
ncbi:hypothetical protein ACLB2K_021063 [Fragaria x ananassa]